MPPKRKAASKAAATRTRRSARNKKDEEPSIPDVYQEMLIEAVSSAAAEPTPRPAKRRKVDNELRAETSSAIALSSTRDAENVKTDDEFEAPSNQQVVYDDFEGSDDDMEFEDVDLSMSETEDKPERKVLTIDLSKPLDGPTSSKPRRQIASVVERKMRLEWHKAHLFLLLLSVWSRNRWCENQDVQRVLKQLVPKKIVKLLHEDESKTEIQRSYSFNKGIEEICQLWRTTWTTVGRGIRKAVWRDDINVEKEGNLAEDVDLDDFKTAAQTLCGSRDLGAQLFCALLRAVAVDTRLVCSLQVLPFSAAAKGQTPQKAKPGYTYAPSQDFGSSSTATAKKKSKESPFPVYWVEVFSPSSSSWIPLDPVVRNTINKPKTGFEPPASDAFNSMSYVVAFEDDGSARDVTRRYTQWFNAKTRRTRVESTKGGEEWWRTTLVPFTKPFREDRDDLEDTDLRRRSETEGLPKNIQDFKGHPVYVLERHLRMNEVIHPKREIGKAAVGLGQKKSKLESVYRRSDVYTCRTADAWYRRGSDVKQGETPLKRLTKRIRGNVPDDEDGMMDQGEATLYADFQTEVYVPPPVENGRIPRNAFGNIDVYVPSMIPPGAVHVQHPLAAKAAKLMGIDYVEAVTGFDFKGRQGTAIINGVVVSAEARFGLVTVIVGMQNDAVSEARAERTAVLLALWKRWVTALKIRSRIQREYGDGNGGEEDDDDPTCLEADDGGGFMPESEDGPVDGGPSDAMEAPGDPMSKVLLKGLPPEPSTAEIIVVESPHKLAISEQPTLSKPPAPKLDHPCKADARSEEPGGFDPEEGGGFDLEEAGGFDAEEGGGFMVDDDMSPAPLADADLVDQAAGGFLAGDDGDAADDTPFVPSIQILDRAISQLQHPGPVIPSTETSGGFYYPSQDERPTASQTSPPLQRPRIEVSSTKHSQDQIQQATEQSKGPAAQAKTDAPSDSEPDDVGSATSMLSHDPDEDELEPEWLVDSLGD